MDVLPIPELFRQTGSIRGWLTPDREVICIDKVCITDDTYKTNYRFCLAHEVGHLYLHADLWAEAEQFIETTDDPLEAASQVVNRFDEQEQSRLEYQCSAFASHVLAPLDLFQDVYEEEIESTLQKAQEVPAWVNIDDAMEEVVEDIAKRTAQRFHVHKTTTKPQIKRAGLYDDLKRRVERALRL